MEVIRYNRTWLIVKCVICLIICVVSAIGAFSLVRSLPSQYEYVRWKGDGDLPFSQISCFLPADGKSTLSDVYKFRTGMLSAFRDASIDTSDGYRFIDCWSSDGSAKVYGERNSGTASIIAVGGEFFSFHPLKLVNGNYFSEGDLMRDNILLDEDMAWFLFGGNDLEGLTVHIFDTPFRIAGVVARENDFASRKAYAGGAGLYMSYDAYLDLSGEEDFGITCYEVCIPNPVKGFAKNLADKEYPIGKGEILENAGRFSFWNLLIAAKNIAVRTMHAGPSYPYWENAARYAESLGGILVCLAILSGLVPGTALFILLLIRLRILRVKLQDDVLPDLSDRAQESIRKRQRKRWEKKHGAHQK